MNIKIIIVLLLLCIPSFLLIQRVGWIEPDSFAFYNRTCNGGSDFTTPVLSYAVFGLIPCNEIAWKLFQLFLIFCTFSAFYYGCKKLKIETRNVWLLGMSGFFISFILGLEDDHLAMPIIVATTYAYFTNPKKFIFIYAPIGIFLTYFVWQGAFIPYAIAIATSFFMPGGIASVALAKLTGYLSNDASAELTQGYAFFSNNLIGFFLFFPKLYKGLLEKFEYGRLMFFYSTALLLLGFFIPKFGFLSVIGLVPIGAVIQNYYVQWKEYIFLFGFLAVIFSSSILLINSQPNEKMWEIIRAGVELQNNGNELRNEWWNGRWITYAGGRPNEQGGNAGQPFYSPPGVWYWIGTQKKECTTLMEENILFLQRCETFKNT